jgi:signal transduction histidine kinase
MKNELKDNAADYIFMFQKELEFYVRTQEVLNNNEISPEDLKAEYRTLSSKYNKLIKEVMKITRIGDMHQSKLAKAGEQIERQKNELEELNSQLRKSNTTKDKFYSIIAHDLRNPLHLLLFSSELLGTRYELGQIDENTIRQYIGKVLKAAGNMSQLLENLLQWSRSQSGSLECRPRWLDIKRLLEDITAYFSDFVEKKSIDLQTDVKSNIRANADEEMIKCVIRNLVDNAVKFTNPGGTITVSAREKGEFVIISVSDTGDGIPEEKLPFLFNIGESTPTSGTAREKGSGLGLPLCREFVEKNEGKISVTSRPGKGSVFEFSLPRP